MLTQPHFAPIRDELSPANRRRSPWRRRLVEAERGFARGFRGDSVLMVHLFVACVVVAAAVVLGLSVIEWAVLVVSFTLVLAAELFNKMVQTVCRDCSPLAPGVAATRPAERTGANRLAERVDYVAGEPGEAAGRESSPTDRETRAAGSEVVRQAASLGTAAVLVSIVGALIVVGLLLGGRVWEIFGRS